MQTPATHDATEEEEPEPLSQVQHSKHRSQDARCLFLSQDRADITFVHCDVKRLVRYLRRERQWGHIPGYGRLVEEVSTVTDSD